MNKKTDTDSFEKLKSVGPLIGNGSQLAVTMVVFVLLGKYIDDKNNVYPLWTIILASLGIIIGLYGFVKTIISYTKKPEKK